MTIDTRPLLIELQTEELPPKALHAMEQAFGAALQHGLAQRHLLADGCQLTTFATPRRLAARLSAVRSQAPMQAFREKLMPAKVGLDADGQATAALTRKLDALGLSHLKTDDLVRESDGRQDFLYAEGESAGARLADGVQAALDDAVGKLPIPKVMRYQLADGTTSVRFVRPAHGLVALWGADVVAVQALGLQADRHTAGHRFLGTRAPLALDHANHYEGLLHLQGGGVVASLSERRAAILSSLQAEAARWQASLGDPAAVETLLDEVTALVESPAVYTGTFDEAFLRVPPECLILTMRLNQKYFPLFDADSGRLTHRFLVVSNMPIADPSHIIAGNERVVRPRLADAQFFFDTDRGQTLASRVDTLQSSVYHNQLGSQRDRIERVRALSRQLADALGADAVLADRAALLAKADLTTLMVGEFPELQGVMGAHYAQADGEDPAVVQAIAQQYRLRIAAPVTADDRVAVLLFMADRLETLVGIWGVGLKPTGERDPYGLRRAALGLISAYEQLQAGGHLALHDHDTLALPALLAQAFALFPQQVLAADTVDEVTDFIYERYRNQLADGHDRAAIDAVLALRPPLHQVRARLQACEHFADDPAAASLAAANKRIANILRQDDSNRTSLDQALLTEPAERALAQTLARLAPEAQAHLATGAFEPAMAVMAQAREPVDQFFADVMVMADDPAVRANRIALLRGLHAAMNQVADLSRLAN